MILDDVFTDLRPRPTPTAQPSLPVPSLPPKGKENTPLKRKAPADTKSSKKAKTDRRASHAGFFGNPPCTPPRSHTSLRAPNSLPSSHLNFGSLPFDDVLPWDEWIDWDPLQAAQGVSASTAGPAIGPQLAEAQLPTALPSTHNPKPDLTCHANVLARIAYFADHASLLALRGASRQLHAAAEQRLFAHVGVFTRGDIALLVSPDEPFHRLPFNPASAERILNSAYAPPIAVVDMLSCPPSYALGQTLPLPLLSSALDTLTAKAPLALLRGERFELHPTTRRAVLHVTPRNLEPGQTTATSVVWHTHTWCLSHALAEFLATKTYYEDLTLVLDPFVWSYPRSAEACPALSYSAGCDILDALGNYLLTYPGRLTIVGAERYVRAGAWMVPRLLAGTGKGVTQWVRQEMRDREYVGAFGGGDDGQKTVERLTMVYTKEWEATRGEGWKQEMEVQRRLARPAKDAGGLVTRGV